MQVVKTVEELKKIRNEWKKEGLKIGLVPTMGYLHAGHISLAKKSVEENDKTILTIFVNPIQFGPNEDLEKYPRDFKKDSELCEKAGVDLIFAPEVDEVYPKNFTTHVDESEVSKELCGKNRVGHFQGVCTVVAKLFNMTLADKAYFGEKDAQQLAVIKRMVRDLNFDVEIIPCPIVREEDGLAMSSRNAYLNEEERKVALCLSKALGTAKELMKAGERNSSVIKSKVREMIEREPLAKIDYIEIVDNKNIQINDEIKETILLAIAVFIGKTRLIDNITFEA